MYGYFQPKYAKLTKEEREVFDTYYCRLCYCLRLLGGQALRYLTSFDITIYSLIYNVATEGERPPHFSCQKIGTSTMKKFANDTVGLRLGALALIGLGEKIRDDILDDNSLKAKSLYAMLKKPITTAQNNEPKLRELAFNATTLIDQMQNENKPLNDILDVYGKMLADIFCEFAPLDDKFRRLYHNLGKWTFYIDMLCDYDEDYATNDYNGFKQEGKKTLKEYFDDNYLQLIQCNREIGGALLASLEETNNGSMEWTVVYKIICRALNTVAAALVNGETVQFNYFKSQTQRLAQELARRERSNFY